MGEIVTLGVGQAGCQVATSLYQLLADEAGFGGRNAAAGCADVADRFFCLPGAAGKQRPAARAVLIDMEPKVVAAAQAATARSGAWQYSRGAVLGKQGGGSANNWAAGALRHGPSVRRQAVGMLRRQAERCDRLAGFLVAQSAAGGTGSGLGSAMTEAVKDEFSRDGILNHCIWPFGCGEVVTQPYNCLLSLASLTQHSDGVIVAENEAMAATCQRLLGIPRPAYADLNALAARTLASVLLPSTVKQAPGLQAESNVGCRRGRESSGRGSARPAWDACLAAPSPSRPQQAPAGAAAWDGTFSSGSRWSDGEDDAGTGRSGLVPGASLDPFADVCQRLCSTPGNPLLSLRTCPQLPPASCAFTTFSWPAVLRDLKQMQAEGRAVEAGAAAASYSSAGSSTVGSRGLTGQAGKNGRLCRNKALASLLILRGDGALAQDASCLADPTLFGAGALGQPQGQPLRVAASGCRLGGQEMAATLLSCDQAAAAPAAHALSRAMQLYESRAYVHHYERHGLACSDFDKAFEAVQGIVERYQAL